MERADADTLVVISALTARERRLLSRGGEPVDPADQLSALEDAVSALESSQIPCALIGGLAVGVRAGVPRATMDVDLAVVTSVPRARVVEALTGAGFEARGEHAHSINFGHRTGEPVRVAFDPDFDAIVERAEPVLLGDVEVPVVRRSDLIVMKERAGGTPRAGGARPCATSPTSSCCAATCRRTTRGGRAAARVGRVGEGPVAVRRQPRPWRQLTRAATTSRRAARCRGRRRRCRRPGGAARAPARPPGPRRPRPG